MDYGTLHLLINLHHLENGRVDIRRMIERNLQVQQVPHSQVTDHPPIRSMSEETLQGLKRCISAKKTQSQGHGKFLKRETKALSRLSCTIKKELPANPESLLSPLDRLAQIPERNPKRVNLSPEISVKRKNHSQQEQHSMTSSSSKYCKAASSSSGDAYRNHKDQSHHIHQSHDIHMTGSHDKQNIGPPSKHRQEKVDLISVTDVNDEESHSPVGQVLKGKSVDGVEYLSVTLHEGLQHRSDTPPQHLHLSDTPLEHLHHSDTPLEHLHHSDNQLEHLQHSDAPLEHLHNSGVFNESFQYHIANLAESVKQHSSTSSVEFQHQGGLYAGDLLVPSHSGIIHDGTCNSNRKLLDKYQLGAGNVYHDKGTQNTQNTQQVDEDKAKFDKEDDLLLSSGQRCDRSTSSEIFVNTAGKYNDHSHQAQRAGLCLQTDHGRSQHYSDDVCHSNKTLNSPSVYRSSLGGVGSLNTDVSVKQQGTIAQTSVLRNYDKHAHQHSHLEPQYDSFSLASNMNSQNSVMVSSNQIDQYKVFYPIPQQSSSYDASLKVHSKNLLPSSETVNATTTTTGGPIPVVNCQEFDTGRNTTHEEFGENVIGGEKKVITPNTDKPTFSDRIKTQMSTIDKNSSIDVLEMETIIGVLVKAQKCFSEKSKIPEKTAHSTVPKPEQRPCDTVYGSGDGAVAGSSGHSDGELLEMMTKLIENSIMQIIKFAKKIPGFTSFSLQDQANLLKCSKSESLMVGASELVDPFKQLFHMPTGESLLFKDLERVLSKDFLDKKVQIGRKICELNFSERETAILRAMIITCPDRCKLEDKQKVERIYNIMYKCLQREVQENFADVNSRLKSIFDILDFMSDVTASQSPSMIKVFQESGILCRNQLLAEYMNL